MKRYLPVSLVAGVMLFAAAAAFASDVLEPSPSTAQQSVAVRKLAMVSQGGLAGDAGEKIAAGNLKGVASSARALAVSAAILPLLFKDTFTEVYPVKGDKYYFKGAPVADVVAGFAALNAAAEDLVNIAGSGDKAAADAQLKKVFGTCGGCHTPYRGQY